MPRRREGRSRLTEGETSELDEHHFNRDITAACGRKQTAVQASLGANRKCRVGAAEVLELEVALAEGTDNAVFGGSAGINRQRHTRTGVELIAEAIALAGVAGIEGLAVDAAVERGVDAQITTQLDAGVGARNVEETGTIQGADPHVLDRFGLDGKISCLCPTHGDETPPLSRG